jgi:hypothetical protein
MMVWMVVPEEINIEREESSHMTEDLCNTGVWKMYFGGALSSEGEGAGVLLVAPEGKFIVPFSYRLQWDIDYTNNVCEYEALILGLEATKKLNINNLEVYCDAELIVKQINRQYLAKHPRLRTYIKLCLGSHGKLFLISKCPLYPSRREFTC